MTVDLNPTGIERLVCEDITERQKFGTQKYGTTIADNPLSLLEWLNHSYLERLDDLLYTRMCIEKLKQQIAATPK